MDIDLNIERRNRLAELLGAAACDDGAFAELYALTHSYLYHVALRVLRSPAHADEVLQDAYVTIWLQAQRFQPGLGSAMTWMITIVRNHALSALRSQRLERRTLVPADDPAALEAAVAEDCAGADPIRDAFYATVRGRLPGALARLEPPQRQAIALTFGGGLAHGEVAEHMRAPLGTVKSWLRRGMARLTDYLAEGGAPPQPPSPARGRKQRAAMQC